VRAGGVGGRVYATCTHPDCSRLEVIARAIGLGGKVDAVAVPL
jgi:hypothetical protein